MALGIHTFGNIVAGSHTDRPRTHAPDARHCSAGVHHGLGFVNSATATTLAVMAAQTRCTG